MPRALYLHVPFCPVVCPYCDFHKMRRHEGLVARYLERLEREALEAYEEFSIPEASCAARAQVPEASCAARAQAALDTVYLGGGTPSLLADDELARIVDIFTRTWGWPAREETTLEADPLTFDRARLQTFKALGFSRLSIGVQSTQDEVLGFLGRRHKGKEGLEAVEMALEAGFEVSADVMTAIPGQDAAKDLHALASTGVPHLSVYTLTIEANTPFHRRGVHIDPDKEADDYALANAILEGYGLRRYEISSHALPGHEARHNSAYWRMDYYLALGPSASGFVPVRDTPNVVAERRTGKPIKAWLAGEAPERLRVSPQAFAEDALMAGLRTVWGVDLAEIERRSGFLARDHYAPLVERFTKEGLLELKDSRLRATEAGLWRLNGIVQAFFSHRPASQPLTATSTP
jgi:putative oxygen-independent coproporphyrinogen III oxidase